MKIDLNFRMPVKSSAKDIWAMKDQLDYTFDIWAQYMGMLAYLDLINYKNGHSFDDPIQTRHAIAYSAFAMPSLAYINPYKTKEMSYLLNLANINIPSKYLVRRVSGYYSDHVKLVQNAMAAGLYRLVSGRDMYDGDFHTLAEKIYTIIRKNSESSQKIWGIETLTGRFEVLPNAIALMVLELHDKFYGTRYSDCRPYVIEFINSKLKDPESGLFYETYHTGYLGYPDEHVNPKSAYRTNILKANVNGLALTFMHYFDPKGTERAWENYKYLFKEELLSLTANEMKGSLGHSYHTQLGPHSEALFSALLAAKEMDDQDFFELMQNHLFDIGRPYIMEGKLFFEEFGEGEHLMGFFILFARTHVGWIKLFDHPWEKYYGYDNIKAR